MMARGQNREEKAGFFQTYMEKRGNGYFVFTVYTRPNGKTVVLPKNSQPISLGEATLLINQINAVKSQYQDPSSKNTKVVMPQIRYEPNNPLSLGEASLLLNQIYDIKNQASISKHNLTIAKTTLNQKFLKLL